MKNTGYFLKQLSLVLIILFFDLPAYTQNTDSHILTIEEALNMAYENNPKLKYAQLNLQRSLIAKSGSFDFSPAQLNYFSGQLYSPQKDNIISIRQDFGSIPEHFYKLKTARQLANIVIQKPNE
ncbi:MAG: hypothetical protein HC906_01220 [Bacteroidales bacterium]|nr:hypothetical protein [Bacteroidales bacterium]